MVDYIVLALLLIPKPTSDVEDNATRLLMASAFFWKRTAQVGYNQQQLYTRIPIARLKLAKQAFTAVNTQVAQTSKMGSIAFIYTLTATIERG
jgi:hypothetical protein